MGALGWLLNMKFERCTRCTGPLRGAVQEGICKWCLKEMTQSALVSVELTPVEQVTEKSEVLSGSR